MSCAEWHFSVETTQTAGTALGASVFPWWGMKENGWARGLGWCWQRQRGNTTELSRREWLWLLKLQTLITHPFPFLGSYNLIGDNLRKGKNMRGWKYERRLLSIFKVSQLRGIIFALVASYSRLTREWWQSLGANHILLKSKLPSHYIHPLSTSTFFFSLTSPESVELYFYTFPWAWKCFQLL